MQRWMSGSYSRHARMEKGPRPTAHDRRPTSDLLSRQAGGQDMDYPSGLKRTVECLSSPRVPLPT